MTKKKSKKNQKAAQQSAPTVEPGKKEDEIDMLEDIKRDEDLYISESDVTNISNFIRTTNKSFNSLGNTVVEKFNGRCSLAILHALIALFDQDSEDREDVIRRLNIIYIVWRLPEIEAELKLKPLKTMVDVYSHPFSTFLFFAERLETHKIEASLARIIVTNNVQVIEKLTAPDFIQKAAKLDVNKVDTEAYEKWEEANSMHWPEITEEMVSLSKAMRELGCYSERKDHEAGMAEAFYPLVHNPPTLLPPKMIPLECEDPAIAKFCNTDAQRTAHSERVTQVLYSLSADSNIQKRLLDAFTDLEKTVDEYQGEVLSAMTPNEVDECQRSFLEPMADSSDSEIEDDDDVDSDEERAESEFRAMTQAAACDFSEKVIEGCVDRILGGIALTTSKTEMMNLFVKTCNINHEQYARMLTASQTDDVILMMCKSNSKFASSFLARNATSEHGTTLLFRRYLRLCEQLPSVVQALEIVLKLSKDFQDLGKMGTEQQSALLVYMRNTVKNCEESENPPARTVRLVAMLVKKLLRDCVIHVDEVAADIKPFCLKFSENRECSALYKLITSLQSGELHQSQISDPGSANSSITTTTTSVDTSANTHTTTTTTTVVSQVKGQPGQTIKSSTRKVVLHGSSLKALSNMRKTASSLFGHSPRSSPNSSGPSSANPSPGKVVIQHQEVREVEKIVPETGEKPKEDPMKTPSPKSS